MRKYDQPVQGLENMLLWAAMLQGNGQTEAANEAARAVFENKQDRRSLLTDTVNRMTDGRYNRILVRFSMTGDWKGYRDDLLQLIGTCPPGWPRLGAAKSLAEKLEDAVDGLPPALPAEGNFSEVQRQRAAALLENVDATMTMMILGAPWLFTPPPSLRFKPRKDPLVQFLALQSDALPVLAAWLDDETLVPLLARVPGDGASFQGEVLSMLEGVEDPATIQAILSSTQQGGASGQTTLPAPKTRAALARDLCSAILPGSLARGSGRNGMISAVELNAFADRMKGKTALEMARFYLQEDQGQQRLAAAKFVLANGEPADIRRVEQIIMMTEEEYEQSPMVMSYIQVRGKDGVAFADKIVAEWEDDDWQKKQYERLKKQWVPEDEKEEKPVSFEDRLAGYLASEATGDPADQTGAETMGQELMASFRSLPMAERIPALEQVLNVLAGDDLQDSTKRMQLLNLFSVARYPADFERSFGMMGMQNDVQTWEEFLSEDPADLTRRQAQSALNPPGWDAESVLASVRKNKHLWEKLIRRTDASEELSLYGSSLTSGIQAAMVLHNLVARQQGGMGRMNEAMKLYSLPDMGAKYWQKSALAIIEGETDDGLEVPSEENVSKERRDQLVADYKAAGDSAIGAWVDGLTYDEYLALLTLVMEGADEELNRKVDRQSLQITEVTCTLDDRSLVDRFQSLKNKPVSTAVLKLCLDGVREKAAEGTGVMAWVSFSLNGARLRAGEAPSAMRQAMLGRREGKAFAGGVMVNITCDEQNAYSMLPLDEPEKSGKTGAGASGNLDQDLDDDMFFGAEEEDRIWEIMRAFDNREMSPLRSAFAMIQVIGMVPKEAKTETTE